MASNPIRILLAGVTGWTGSEVARAILDSADLKLCGAVARQSAGRDVGEVLGRPAAGVTIVSTVSEALGRAANVARDKAASDDAAASPFDVFIDYTSAASVQANVLAAVERGIATIVGSSGLTATDYDKIDRLARERSCGVIACGNFAITAALAKHFALIAARYLPHREIIDYAPGKKIDVPSGTVRELAEELANVQANQLIRTNDQIIGPIEARGAAIGGTPVHSVRLPGYVLSFETVFGLPEERLSIRHDAGSGAAPYVDGTLLAVRRVGAITGLVRGLDNLLFSSGGAGGN